LRRTLEKFIGFVGYYLGSTRLMIVTAELLGREKILVALTYHRITDRSHGDLGYLIYDVGDDFRSFDVQIATIKKYFNVVGVSEYFEYISGKVRPAKRAALVTFDDADGEFAKYALPVLQKHGCKSVVFAPTDFIGSDKRFWHLRLTNLIVSIDVAGWEKVRDCADQFPAPVAAAIRKSSVADESDKGRACRSLAHAIDRFEADQIDVMVAEFEKITGTKYTLGVSCLDWDGLSAIARQGVEVESHSVTHRKLALLDRDTVRRELTDSKALLEEKLGRPVTAICYPAGSFNETVLQVAEDAGYLLGFTTKFGLGSTKKQGIDRYRLRRAAMYGDSKYEADLHLAKMILKTILFGKTPN
jgi:peptidoglycan/xylan/chitin deacetylase (PgdA/CDA1 family)